MDKRKRLKEQYKEMRPDMGIIAVKCPATGKAYFRAAVNTKAAINSMVFQLKHGSSFNRDLQKEWNELGEGAFEVGVIEALEYEKDDDGTTDYKAYLQMMLEEWLNKTENSKEII